MSWTWRDFVWFLRFCVVVAACVQAIELLAGGWHGWARMLRSFSIGLLFSVEIGSLAWLVTPAVAQKVSDWRPFSRWAVILATLLLAGVIGTWLAVQVLRLFGFSLGFGQALSGSLAITLIVGVLTTMFETSKARLQETELALRTQQMERERAEKLAAEAQLASLTSRVQPHFLFNTLNSISALIREDPRQAEEMLQQLSSLLRGSLDTARTIPIETELKLVRDYLEIQRIRLGQRLRYEVEWSATALDGATIPPFSIQTIVENAVKHVAGQRQEGVALRLRVTGANGDLVVEVADDGAGFNPDAVKAGHGLDNLQARLRSLYGERAGLEFDRRLAGMTVRIRVPAL
jgi:two-component system, LytTR family, sensor histidine kinase AlgZ